MARNEKICNYININVYLFIKVQKQYNFKYV